MKPAQILAAQAAGCMLVFAFAMAEPAAEGAATDIKAQPSQYQITKVTPAYWRISINHPPFNIFGPESIPMLNAVVTAIEKDPELKVVVFESKVPGFFHTHYDFIAPLEATTKLPRAASGLEQFPDMLVRLTKTGVVSIASIRGRATGVGSELALACDMRFASREKGLLSQFEIGAGFVPGGGPMARLPRLVGRGRAMEILLSGNDISADVAERYGYINRALPDAELDNFVDALARRISTFDKQSLSEIKQMVNAASLPSDKEVGAEWGAFLQSVQRPTAQHNIKQLLEWGLQKNPEIEIHLPKYTGKANLLDK